MPSPESLRGIHLGEYFDIDFSHEDFLSIFREYKAIAVDSPQAKLRKNELAEKMIDMNEGIIRQVAYRLYFPLPSYLKTRIDLEDLLQVGRMTTFRAFNTYETHRGKWSTYVYVSLERRLNSAINRMRTLKTSARTLQSKRPLDGYQISLERSQSKGDESIDYYDLSLSETQRVFDPVVEIVLTNEIFREYRSYKEKLRVAILDVLAKLPSTYRKAGIYFQAFFVQGLSSAEVARKYNVTIQAVTAGLRQIYDYLWLNIPDEMLFLKKYKLKNPEYLKQLLRILWPQVTETEIR